MASGHQGGTLQISESEGFMRQCILAILVASVLTLAACSGSGGETSGSTRTSPSGSSSSDSSPTAGSGVTITLGQTAFVQSSVTISAGQILHIVDPLESGGAHNLCFGDNGQCDQAAQGPSELLAPGLMFTPGASKDILFPHAGSYQVTCTIHPGMLLTIDVIATGP